MAETKSVIQQRIDIARRIFDIGTEARAMLSGGIYPPVKIRDITTDDTDVVINFHYLEGGLSDRIYHPNKNLQTERFVFDTDSTKGVGKCRDIIRKLTDSETVDSWTRPYVKRFFEEYPDQQPVEALA